MNTWIVSDTHFGHKNMLSFKRKDGKPLRDFSSGDEMDQHMIKCWNSVVDPEDKVYHLGDVGFTNFTYTKRVFDFLHGDKVLVKGNHDNFKLSQYSQIFRDVRAYHVLDKILLAHIPVHPDSLNRWRGQVHGHTHSNSLTDPRYYNASVEVTDYTPVNFNDIRKYYEAL